MSKYNIREIEEYEGILNDKRLLIKGLRYGILVALIYTIASTVLFLMFPTVSATPIDYEYDFTEDVLFDGNIGTAEALFNQRTQQYNTKHYEGTYSFEEDEVGGDPSDWVLDESGGTINILGIWDNHSKVVEFSDTNTDKVIATNSFEEQENGTVEYYWYFEDLSKGSMIIIYDNSIAYSFILGASGDIFWYNDPVNPIEPALEDVWYHIKIIFDCSDNEAQLYFNNTYIDTIPSLLQPTAIDRILFQSVTTDSGYKFYIDAIGYSWDTDYEIGDNWFPIIENKEIVQYGFDSIDFNYGSEYSGELNDMLINDTNYYVLESESDDGEYIDADFYIEDYVFEGYAYFVGKIESFDPSETLFLKDDDGNLLNYSDDDEFALEFEFNNTNHFNIAVGDMGMTSFYLYIDYFGVYNYKLNSSFEETDKFEFAFDEAGDPNNIGDDNINGWTDVENDYFSYDSVNCWESDDSGDKSYRIYRTQKGESGFYRDFEEADGDLFQVNFSMDMEYNVPEGRFGFGQDDSYFFIEIYSYDETLLYDIKISGTYNVIDKLEYRLGEDYQLLNDSLSYEADWEFYFEWDSEGNGIFSYNGYEYEIDPLVSKAGLGTIGCYANNPTDIIVFNCWFEIDAIGIYKDGLSLSDEVSPNDVYILSGVAEWDFSTHNFVYLTFNFTLENNITILVNGEKTIIGYNDTIATDSYFVNVFDESASYNGAFLQIVNESDWEITNMKISGIALDFNGNLLYPDFESSNLDLNESYFFISSDRLGYTYTADDDELEYMMLTFEGDISTDNRSIAGGGIIDNGDIGAEFRINYEGGKTSIFIAGVSYSSYNLVLPQEEFIDSYTFIVSDNDASNDDSTVGYFDSFVLIYNPSIELVITTTSLLTAIIPLTVVFVPTLAIYGFLSSRDKDLARSSFIPLVVLFSIVCLAGSLIEAWMFFIIAFASAMLMFMRRRD
jgi:hypothetical protein